jgi:hypothetical protein
MPRDERDHFEERQLHGSDDDDRDDTLVAIQEAMRQISARVDALASGRPVGSGARGRARRRTPPRGRMPANSVDNAHSDAGRSNTGRSSGINYLFV